MLTSTKVSRRRLRKLMADRDWRSHDVARILGVRPQTVRLYMCGVRSMSLAQFKQLGAL